jgi:hypothetical protein
MLPREKKRMALESWARGGGREGAASRQAIGAWYTLWNVMLVVVMMMIYMKWMREKRGDDI